ncbi:MAG: hypothetical protein DRQ55_10360 [Planctomycetota bacterium]|nr:MAG: hypothetical protein DRQ55_10360 [Planctomycetota bacterium]
MAEPPARACPCFDAVMTADRRSRLRACHLYLVASVPEAADPSDPPAFWWTAVEASVRGGAGAVQLRAKQASTDQRCRLVALARQRLGPKVLLIINDDLRAARCDDADGLHLGREDAERLGQQYFEPDPGEELTWGALGLELFASTERRPEADGPAQPDLGTLLGGLGPAGCASPGSDSPADRRCMGLLVARGGLGPTKLLGTSTRDAGEIRRALSGLADHVGFGAMAVSGTKPDATLADPLELRSCGRRFAQLPVFPIGGVDSRTLGRVLDANLDRAAVGAALMDAEDPWALASELLRRLTHDRLRRADQDGAAGA